MKKLLGLLLLTMFVTSVSYAQTRETRDLDNFTGVGFGVAGTLIIEQGGNFSVVLEGDEDYLKEIETTVRGDILVIRHGRWMTFNNKKVTVYVTMPEIEELNVSGSGNIIAEKSIKTGDLDMSISGSGNIKLSELTAESIDCSISGSGSLELKGSAEEGELSISGSGKYRGNDFRLETLDVSISGSGTCYTSVEESLIARVSGSGDIYYSGSPRVDARVSGSGKVRKN
ncbi:MAG: head GIN domain-containing protein [Bacteroidales bacterium]|nr:head GIN domain-containing protein [Bacteroidales bacterium]